MKKTNGLHDAVKRLKAIVDERSPEIIFFGESHPTRDKDATFRDFFHCSINELLPEGFDTVFIEISHLANKDFREFLKHRIGLKTFRQKWFGENTIWTNTSDDFFYKLREYSENGGRVQLINKSKDPGRDCLMVRKILKQIYLGHKASYLCGSIHSMVRVAPRQTWKSCAERVSESIGTNKLLSLVEISRKLWLDNDYDERLPDLINGHSKIKLIPREELDSFNDCVIAEPLIGKGTRWFTEFEKQHLFERIRHHNAIYVDPIPFIPPQEEYDLKKLPEKVSYPDLPD
jgi:hypothetical protein